MLKSQSESRLETVQENRRREVIPTKKDPQRNLTTLVFSKLTNLHLAAGDRIDRLITQASLVQKYKRELLTCLLQQLISLVVLIQLDIAILSLLAKFSQVKEIGQQLPNITVKLSLKVLQVVSTKPSLKITKLRTFLNPTT